MLAICVLANNQLLWADIGPLKDFWVYRSVHTGKVHKKMYLSTVNKITQVEVDVYLAIKIS